MPGNVIRADLQFHPFDKAGYGLYEILTKMEEKGIDILGCLVYLWDRRVSFSSLQISRKVKRYYEFEPKNNVFSFLNKETGRILHIIFGQELAPPDQKWHFLALGVLGLKLRNTPCQIIDEVLDKGGLFIFDHPFADPQKWFAHIPKSKNKELYRICNKYRGEMALEWNGYSPSYIRRLLPGYWNTNEETVWLGKNFNIPVVPTTDTHAVSKKALNAIGCCHIEIPASDMDLDILASLKENIFNFNFKARCRTVSFFHLFRSFIAPYLRNKIAAK